MPSTIPGVDTAETAFEELIGDATFELPDVDLSGDEFKLPDSASLTVPVDRIQNKDLTEKLVDGEGTFDVLMAALRIHLEKEFQANRITGELYAKTYIALTEGAMGQAVQFLIAKDGAYWQAITAQQQALTAQAQTVTARVELEIAKARLYSARLEANTLAVNYALTKMKLATETAGYETARFQVDELLPAQRDLVNEQKETARAQTLDTRSDGVTPVVGLVGKQRDLYAQQITSYKRDAEVKAAKLFTDAWITMKTIDEGLLPPTSYDNTNLQDILSTIKANNELTQL